MLGRSSAFLTVVLVLIVTGRVSGLALKDAVGGVAALSGAGRPAAVDMVLARRDGVGTAACRRKHGVRISDATHQIITVGAAHSKLTDVGVIEASRDQSHLSPEVPGGRRPAAIASEDEKCQCVHLWRGESSRDGILKFCYWFINGLGPENVNDMLEL